MHGKQVTPDGYFAVTAHWIEEPTPAKWELKSALIGLRGSTMHTMVNGSAKLYSRSSNELGIEHKVSVFYGWHHVLLHLLSTMKRLAISPAIMQATIQL
jgi:hypothetical protein